MQRGVNVFNGAQNNRIGTNADGSNDAVERNIIVGNGGEGIQFTGTNTSHNVAAGNYIDALLVINDLNAFGSGPVPDNAVGPPFYDTTGDFFVSPIDALLVINYINSINAFLAGRRSGGPASGGRCRFPIAG